MPTVADCAYIAGLIDGDGYIGIGKMDNLAIIIHLTTYEPLGWVLETFGGSLTFQPRSKGYSKYSQSKWMWQIGATEGLKLLRLIEPYIRLKKEQTRLGIEFQAHRSLNRFSVKNKITSEERRYRQMSYATMRLLNRRGKQDEIDSHKEEYMQRKWQRNNEF